MAKRKLYLLQSQDRVMFSTHLIWLNKGYTTKEDLAEKWKKSSNRNQTRRYIELKEITEIDTPKPPATWTT